MEEIRKRITVEYEGEKKEGKGITFLFEHYEETGSVRSFKGIGSVTPGEAALLIAELTNYLEGNLNEEEMMEAVELIESYKAEIGAEEKTEH